MKRICYEKMIHDIGGIYPVEEIKYLAQQFIMDYRIGQEIDFELWTKFQYLRDFAYMLDSRDEPQQFKLFA